MPKVDRYFFGYASNMALWVMAEICPHHGVMGAARLDDYKLTFPKQSKGWGGGVADVIHSPGDHVWGVLYAIDEQCHDALDQKAHFGVGYTTMLCDVFFPPKDKNYHALTYTIMEKSEQHFPPSRYYLDTMLEGAREMKLPADYVAQLAALKTSD